ncbi:metallo-beta-lactamase domain-containing protein 1 [Brachionichthys hirsutus]|uniref:metallo-beta-lactamase domain-containing protein 1 n=1 Tax=Brachionichthys hirsutus TaxID=412623 RepID=UPI0036053064
MTETEAEAVCGGIRIEPVPESQLDLSGPPYSVSVLQVGYCLPQTDGTFRADGTVTLLRGHRVVLVDTGGPWGRDVLQSALKERGLEPGDVDFVVGTHGHSDHIGNLSLFNNAVMIVGYDVSKGDAYRPNRLAEGHPYVIDEHVSVIPSPGHTGQDVSVQVKGTSAGLVLVAGDLFECCSDEDSWRNSSLNPAVQEVSRQEALRTADLIVPGHGRPFRVLRDRSSEETPG